MAARHTPQQTAHSVLLQHVADSGCSQQHMVGLQLIGGVSKDDTWLWLNSVVQAV